MTAARVVAIPEQGLSTHRIGRLSPVPFAAWWLCLLVLGGCAEMTALDINPFNVNGREGANPLDVDTLMRIGARVKSGGDLPNAVALYRRAAVVAPSAPAPFVAAGNTLMEMGQVDEAILAYKSALDRIENDPAALRGLAKAYLRTARPELAGAPLAVAYKQTPEDPKLLQLIGVADDYLGQHGEAQDRYRRGLELLPRDPALTVNLALSLALTENYAEAVGVLRPIAIAPTGNPHERQTLALIYGLAGDGASAEKMARLDLDPASVQHNLAYYDALRQLPPEARLRALQSISNPNETALSYCAAC